MSSWLTIAKQVDNNIELAVSKNGWMDSDLFYSWFQRFIAHFTQRPLLLIYDGHSSHVTYKVVKLARDEQISLLKLPPHTTDKLQPLDVACFAPLKRVWDKAMHKWNQENAGERIPRHEFIRLTGYLS